MLRAVFLVIGCMLAFVGSVAAQAPGFGAMGASETDGTTLLGSWVPHLVANRGINFGPGQAWNVAVGAGPDVPVVGVMALA